MSNQGKNVKEGRAVCNTEQDEWREMPPTSSGLKARMLREVEEVFIFLDEKEDYSWDQVEKGIISRVFTLGRLFLAYFLARRQGALPAKGRGHEGGGVPRAASPAPPPRYLLRQGTLLAHLPAPEGRRRGRVSPRCRLG